MKYDVLVTREVTESCTVRVEAGSVREAERLAVPMANNGPTIEWSVDDGSQQDPYICDPGECAEEVTTAETPFVLTDPSGAGRLGGKISAGEGLNVFLDGFGTAGVASGFGALIYLEFYEGKPMLRVWADINQEDPTHTIDLSGAMEARRKDGAA